MNVDMLSVSGHKLHGPKGSGFLYIKDKTKVKPILFGGGQQKGMRSGTENVPAIAGLGVACEEIYRNYDANYVHLREVKEAFLKRDRHHRGNTYQWLCGRGFGTAHCQCQLRGDR